MLDDKLEEARAQNSRKVEKFILSAVGIVVLLIVLWFSVLGVKQFLKEKENEQLQASQEKSSEIIDPSSHQRTDKTDTVGSEGDSDKAVQKENEELRSQFKELLSSFETEVEPKLPPGNGWKNEELFEIDNLKKESLGYFANGNYIEAIDKLELTKSLAEEVIEETDQAFDEEIAKAQMHYEKDQYEEAKLHIEKALFIKPQEQKALKLQKEIQTLGEILPLLAAIEVARAENDLQKEYTLLSQIEQLFPERSGVKERKSELEELMKAQAFATQIDLAFDLVESGNASKARVHYQKAKEIDPDRQELKVLSGMLLALEKRLRVTSALQKADQAIRRDDWQAAYNSFAKAAKDVPQDSRVLEGLAKAKAITGLKKEIQNYLADPYRLSSTNIADRAEQLLKRAEVFAQDSFSLQLQSRELSAKIGKMQQQIAVTVFSDNKTFVQVRGIGKVGKVTEKIITLKPGKYTFEGRRDGYTTKLVKVLIPYDQPAFQVQIICDQPI